MKNEGMLACGNQKASMTQIVAFDHCEMDENDWLHEIKIIKLQF